jgi:hypothetical protein
MRLALWQQPGRPAEELEPLAKRFNVRHNRDWGWSQAGDMASNAWAAGQALHALDHASIKPDKPVVTRVQAFLVRA